MTDHRQAALNLIEQARNALDGMAEIVRKERLIRGEYVSDSVDAELSTAVCQGHRYCAIGSLWAGGGVHPKKVKAFGDVFFELPGSDEDDREGFLRSRHGLRLAYEALNAAAQRYIERHNLQPVLDENRYEDFRAAIEDLFENAPEGVIGRTEMLRIIASAKRALAAPSNQQQRGGE